VDDVGATTQVPDFRKRGIAIYHTDTHGEKNAWGWDKKQQLSKLDR